MPSKEEILTIERPAIPKKPAPKSRLQKSSRTPTKAFLAGEETMEESPNANSLDDFYVALLNGENLIPVSDEKFAVELHLQEAIFSSILSSLSPRSSPLTSIASTSKLQATPSKSDALIATETGESSLNLCEICVEARLPKEMFKNEGCSHAFCIDCISKHVASKIQENIAMVRCPAVECKGVLEPQICRPLVPAEVLERWEAALTESTILGSQKFYCPFENCSALLIDDGGEAVRESECPNCRRLFCAQCKVPWHSGVGCDEYRELKEYEKGAEDLIVLELAKTKGWRRCSRCRYYVEKTEGCIHMVCRFEFCYRCGLAWSSAHGACEAR